MPFVPRDMLRPYHTMYVRYATTITQLSGFISGREVLLQEPEEQECNHLDRDDPNQVSPEAGLAIGLTEDRIVASVSAVITSGARDLLLGHGTTGPRRPA